jgi:class 3 adenylate cyclase
MSACAACAAADQREGARFCFSCGSPLAPDVCAACRAPLEPGDRFCSGCGAAQAPATAPPPTPSTPVASRRITSVFFGDLVSFTSLSETRDQEDVRELLSSYFEECRRVIGRYGGTVEKFIGDAVMAVWGVPTAHEDDAERAVRAGLELVTRVEALGADLSVPELAMRVGIVTGEVAVTIGAEHQGMVAGDAVNTAARVQSAASPGQVWVDETTRLLTSSAISYVDVGSHAMKGKADPVPLWSVRAVVAAVGGAQRADGLEAPHVGRDRELRLVKELFHGVEETHRPALLVVDGDPGVGKSRLGWEFEKYADGLSTSVRWHSGRCLSYGEGVAFFALAEAVRSRLRVLRTDDAAGDPGEEEDQLHLLAAGLDRYVADPAEREWLEPRLGALLGIGAVGTFPREDLFAAWTTFLHRVSEDEHPVVMLIDDAQHADDGLLMFLEYLLGVATFPCFVALLTRPELLEANPGLATNRRVTVMHLESLSTRDMAQLLDGLVAGLPDSVRASLVERAEGIPLFAVETVRSLIDRDLVLPRGGQYVLADPDRLDLDAVGAPASLQALIAARLDTLPPDQRRVVDRASVVGDSFGRDQIASLCDEVADLDGALASLVRLQLLRQESNRFSTEAGQFQFVQSAVRQVAYGTLSRRDRKASHLAVVELLEAGDDATDESAAIIAQHYLEALDAVPGDPDRDELAAAAVVKLRGAATRAASLGAPAEAAQHLAVAFERCADPALAATIECDLAEQLELAGEHEAAIDHATRARDAFDAAGDALMAGRAAATLSRALTFGRDDFEQAHLVASQRYAALRAVPEAAHVALELGGAMISALLHTGADFGALAEERALLAERVGDDAALAQSYVSLALHYSNKGAERLSRVLDEAAAVLAREAHDSRLAATALVNLSASWIPDDAEAAGEIGRRAVDAARAGGDQSSLSGAVVNATLSMLLTGDWDEAMALLDGDMCSGGDTVYAELVAGEIASARGQRRERLVSLEDQVLDQDPGVRACAQLIRGREVVASGADGAGALAVRAVRELFEVTGTVDDFTSVFRVATDLVEDVGDTRALGSLLTVLDEDPHQTFPVGLQAQHQRVLALLGMHGGGEPATVEEHLSAAVALSRAWRSSVSVARCQAALGVWLTRQGRAAEAREPLAEARAVYTRLGAVRWSEQLAADLAGVTA